MRRGDQHVQLSNTGACLALCTHFGQAVDHTRDMQVVEAGAVSFQQRLQLPKRFADRDGLGQRSVVE